MNGFVKSFIIVCALIHSVYGVYPHFQNVPNFPLKRQLTFQDPFTSTKCFSDYILKSNEVSKAYGRNYKRCLLDAKSDRQLTDTEVMGKRIAIVSRSQDVYNRLLACDGLNTTLAIFHCHAAIGANNTKDVYNISENSTQYALELEEKYRIIHVQHENCSKIAERSYVEATGVTYRTLQACLGGRIESIPSIATTTTALVTGTSTTTPPIINSRNIPAPATIGTESNTFNTISSDASERLDTTILPGSEEFAKQLSKLLK